MEELIESMENAMIEERLKLNDCKTVEDRQKVYANISQIYRTYCKMTNDVKKQKRIKWRIFLNILKAVGTGVGTALTIAVPAYTAYMQITDHRESREWMSEWLQTWGKFEETGVFSSQTHERLIGNAMRSIQ